MGPAAAEVTQELGLFQRNQHGAPRLGEMAGQMDNSLSEKVMVTRQGGVECPRAAHLCWWKQVLVYGTFLLKSPSSLTF